MFYAPEAPLWQGSALPPQRRAEEQPVVAIAAQQNAPLGAAVGQLHETYIVAQTHEGLVIVDQHAAHERILFEEMQRRMEQQGVPSQRLLLPLTLQLGPKDADWVERNMELLERAGIALEGFGAGTFKIDSLPMFIKAEDPVQLLHTNIIHLADFRLKERADRFGTERGGSRHVGNVPSCADFSKPNPASCFPLPSRQSGHPPCPSFTTTFSSPRNPPAASTTRSPRTSR
jgi:DNA mismatch repair protein MutL